MDDLRPSPARMPLWKRLALALFFLILAVFLLYALLLGRGPAPARESLGTDEMLAASLVRPADGLEWSFTGTGNTLEELGLCFTGVPAVSEDAPAEEGCVTLRLLREDRLLWGGRLYYRDMEDDALFPVYMNLPTEEGVSYRLTLDAPGPEAPLIYMADGGGAPAAVWTYRLPPSTSARLLYAARWLPVFLAALLLLLFGDRALAPLRRTLDAAPRLHSSPLRRLLDAPGKCFLCLLFLLYSGFALVGSRTLVFPLGGPQSLRKLAAYLAVCLGCAPVLCLLAWAAKKLAPLCLSPRRRLKTPVFILLVLLAVLIPAALALIAHNPLISSPDTLWIVDGAAHLGKQPYNDWMPLLYLLYVCLGLSLWDNVTVIALLNWVFWSFVTVRVFLYLREKGLRDGLLLAAALLVGLSPCNVLLINTGWKDIPYTCSLVWLFLNMAKLVFDRDACRRRTGFYIELALSLVGVFEFRKNGIMSFVCVFLLILLLFRGDKKRWIALIGSLCAVLFIRGPLYQITDTYNSPWNNRMYTGMVQDILGVYYAGGELPEDAVSLVTHATWEDNAAYLYNPTYYSYYNLDHFPYYAFPEFMGITLRTVAESPAVFARASLARNDLTWGVFPGQISYVETARYRWAASSEYPSWTDRAAPRVENRLTGWFDRLEDLTQNPLLDAVLWRCGLWTWIILFAVFLCLLSGRRAVALVLAVVPLSHILGLWISSGYGGEFRFYWPLNVIGFYMLLLIPFIWRQDPRLGEQTEAIRPSESPR